MYKFCKTVKADLPDGAIRFRLTERQVDRDSEVIEPKGIDLKNFKKNPVVVWSHDVWGSKLPVGKILTNSFEQTDKFLDADVQFDLEDPFAAMVYHKYDQGFLNCGSIRFRPTVISKDPVLSGQRGVTFKECELIEFSAVIIPANIGSRQVPPKKDFEPYLKEFEDFPHYEEIKSFYESEDYQFTPDDWMKYCNADGDCIIDDMDGNAPIIKIFDGLDKGFSIDREELDSQYLIYDWASKFCNCNIKDLYMTNTGFTKLWKGTFLSAINLFTKDWNIHDTRNLTASGKEKPPEYEEIELNSKENLNSMIQGTNFYITEDDIKLVVSFEKSWDGGGYVIVYGDVKNRKYIEDFLNKCWRWSEQNHKLKGESFALSGNFLKRTGIDFCSVFTTEKNIKPIKSIVSLVNNKQENCSNRGLVFMGPPGTGKTLSGRVIMNQADSTFIWISAKDFWRMGALHGLASAFSLAKTLTPSILFIEDVDNWMNGHTVDLLKTEMDGIDQSTGLVTILTTNYPEKLPDALIDRPGRFHDVLEFSLPKSEQRSDMLKNWIEDIDSDTLSEFVEKTDGYSGAHLFELCNYVKIISAEEDIEIKDALDKALKKINEQRELINQNQLSGSNYQRAFLAVNEDDKLFDYEPVEEEVEELSMESIEDSNEFFKKYDFTKWEEVAKAMNDLFALDEDTASHVKHYIFNQLSLLYKQFKQEPPELIEQKVLEDQEDYDISKEDEDSIIVDAAINLITNGGKK